MGAVLDETPPSAKVDSVYPQLPWNELKLRCRSSSHFDILRKDDFGPAREYLQ
jgi:hypothetical protein